MDLFGLEKSEGNSLLHQLMHKPDTVHLDWTSSNHNYSTVKPLHGQLMLHKAANIDKCSVVSTRQNTKNCAP